MATPSPLNWNQRKPKVPSLRFRNAEDYARHMTALTAGPTGMHERETIQSGPHKGKTPNQVAAEYMESSGLPSRTTLPMPGLGTMPAPKPPVADSSSIDPGMIRQPSQGIPLPAIKAPSTVLPTIQPPGAPAPAAASSTPAPVAVSQPPPQTGNLLAQGLSDQAAGITQRGTNGSVLYQNGASMSPTSPTGGRVLMMPNGTRGGATSISPSVNPATYEGMPAAQFFQSAAARQNTGNAFTHYKVPSLANPIVPPMASSTAPGPAQKALAAFNAANPNVKTQAEIDQMQQTFKANRDNLTAIQAQKSAAAQPPVNGMQIMTPEVARAAVAADKAQNPSTSAPSDTGRVTMLNGRPYKSPLAADMGLPQPGQPSTPSPAPPAAPVPAKPTGAFYAKAYTPTSLKPPMMLAGARAEGGPVQSGQPYLVGEQGPEIVVPQQSGTVIPNHQIPTLRPPRKAARQPASVIPIKPPSLLSTFG